ncbi:MAG: hypothetical protein IT184_12975 [Acidobacteria bacterium]|nr:hypothetical protein [Acidobacteriota bacterium]
MTDRHAPPCPDCDDPLTFAYEDTSGQGAHKRGDHFNTTPYTRHYLCFPCEKAWKQRLEGPFTPDVVADLAFFSCREGGCGARLHVSAISNDEGAIELTCPHGHRHVVLRANGSNELTVAAVR